ncbi:MAG: carboxypeptidase regulatory-like domain-containing protein, partial [Acidobacteriota bacterium]
MIRAVLTDATGSFRVPGIAPGTYMLDVLATTGQRWTSEPFTVPSPDRHEAGKRIEILPLGEFHLPVGAELEVLAVDALTGAGLAGATVLANQGENVADVVMFETKVNDVGRALLQGLRFEEPAHVKVAAPGYTACEITAVIAPTSVTCSLRPLARIAGRVVARDDTPIPGAAIGFRGTERAHHANDDGRFAIEGVESGTVDLTVAAPGYRPAALRVYVAAGESGEIGEVELEAGER